MLVWKTFLLALTALLPLINPVGSALIFLGLTGDAEVAVYRRLSLNIALMTFGFLVIIEFLGSLLLSFFGVSIPAVQVAGGIVIVATAWKLLFERDASAHVRDKQSEAAECAAAMRADLNTQVLYPFTFPITAGPGTVVVMLTLSAHASNNVLRDRIGAHIGIATAAILLCVCVYFCYANAPRLVRVVSPPTAHGVLRVISFILMCLGVQIAWNGLAQLAPVLLKR